MFFVGLVVIFIFVIFFVFLWLYGLEIFMKCVDFILFIICKVIKFILFGRKKNFEGVVVEEDKNKEKIS